MKSKLSVLAFLLLTIYSYAQNVSRGTVLDQQRQVIAGAAVVVKSADGGILNGTVTEVDGTFEINTLPSDILEISCIGFETMTVKASDNLSSLVLVPDNKFLEEVVVVGYGTQKKVNLTGAVAAVSSEVFEDKSTGSAVQMLQGAMPNVNIQVNSGTPGASGTITVRGIGSVNSSSPLILIDGTPGELSQVGPGDIESVSVLKDAASAAIYGSRAAFGVILVTTKNAAKGRSKVSYNNYFSFSTPTVSTDFVWQGYDHAYIFDTSYFGQKGVMGAATGLTSADYEQLLLRRNDYVEDPSRPWVVEDEDGKYHYWGNFDWWKYLYKTWTPSQSHSISVSGGTDKVTYYVSGNYYTKDGFMRNADEKYRQFSLNAKINAQVYKWLKISNNTYFYDSEHAFPGENASNAMFARTNINCAPYYVPIGPDGNYSGMMACGKILNEGRIADIEGGVSRGNVAKRMFKNTFALSVTPVKGLSINADYTFSFAMQDNWKRQGLVYVSTGYAGKTQLSTSTAHKTDYYEKEMTFDPQHVVNAYATYDGHWGKHNFSATAGMNYEKKQYHTLYGYRTDVMSDSLNDLNLATGGVTIDDNGKIVGEIKATGGAKAYQLMGFFFRADYNFDERYLIELNGRADGSSKFFSKNRWGFFPSISGAWRISQEHFMKNVRPITNLKIRASYGILGNQLGVDTYPYAVISQKQSDYIIDGNLAYYLTAPKPVAGDYTWEKVATANVGLDLGMFKGRLNLSADYFVRDTYDMFVDGVTLPGVYGADPPRQNAGSMRTLGWELSIGWKDNVRLAGSDFSYEVYANLADADSWITHYQGNDAKLLYDESGASMYYEGMHIGEIWGYRTGGLFVNDDDAKKWTGKVNQTYVMRDVYEKSVGDWAVARGGDLRYLDIDGDKVISDGSKTLADHGDLDIIGNSTPRYTFSFGAGFSWYGVDFSIMFQGVGKCDIYPNKEMEKFWGSWGRVNSAFLPSGLASQARSADNPDSYFPALERGGAAYLDRGQLTTVNDNYLQSLAYIRLKNLSIGYTFPDKWMKKIHIQRLRLYAAGDNLAYLSPFHTRFVDPEQAMASSDARVYPFSKTFTFGLNLTF
ncbi:MAG: TonB-dependent receptor [Bacteroidales bacterium]|nr:TonB-dependent receptor [Bacteroidales bacterium]